MPTHAAQSQAAAKLRESATLHDEPPTPEGEQASEEGATHFPATVEQIAVLLREMGETVETYIDCAVLDWRVGERNYEMAIDVESDGTAVRFYIPEFMPVSPGGLSPDLMREVLALNTRIKALKFGSIEGSGRVWVDLALPLEDAGITRRQLRRSLELMRHAIEVERPRLLGLMRSGGGPTEPLRSTAWIPLAATTMSHVAELQEGAIELSQKLSDVLWNLYCAAEWSYEFDRAYDAVIRALAVTTDPERLACFEVHGGMLAERRHKYARAIEHYRRAVAAEPTDAYVGYLAHNNLGYCLNLAEQHVEAEHLCRIAIGVDPERHNAHKNLGIALEGQARLAEAASCYVAATRRCPQDPRALKHLEQLCEAHPELLQDDSNLASDLEECRRLVWKGNG